MIGKFTSHFCSMANELGRQMERNDPGEKKKDISISIP